MKKQLKRALSLMLTVVMLVSCWVFAAPKANAGTAGSYKWRVNVVSSNATGGWDKGAWNVYGKPTNGTGSETSIKTFNQYINFNNTTNVSGDQTTSQFPTKVTFQYQFGAGITHRKMDATIYLDVYNGSSWDCVGSATAYSYEWGKNSGTVTLTVASGNYPKASSIGDISGDATVSVPTGGGTTTKSYTVGTVKDQFNVSWHGDASWDTATTSNGVTFSNGTLTVPASSNRSNNYTVTLKEKCDNASNTKTVTISTFDYKVTFKDASGGTIGSTQTVDYGKSATAPANPTKAYDTTNHYTWKGWSGTYTTIKSGAQNISITPTYNTVAHTGFSYLSSGAKTATTHTVKCSGCAYTKTANHTSVTDAAVPATCTETGLTAGSHCSVCEYVITAQTTTAALGHDYYEIYNSPTNGTEGSVCIGCNNGCGKYWSANYENNTYEPATEYSSEAEATSNTPESAKVSAPQFNAYYNPSMDYNYSLRGASLKIAEPFGFTDRLTRQGLRFTASLHVPEGVDYSGDNNIVDFGFIYSQTNNSYVNNNINNLTLDNVDRNVKKIVKMSVKDNNAGVTFNGHNWTGVTAHADETLGGTTLTFNLVVNVKAYNWSENYCARAYVVYNYNGHEYTVYDNQFSSRSVEYIARRVVENVGVETPKVINYCQSKVVTPIDEGRNV